MRSRSSNFPAARFFWWMILASFMVPIPALIVNHFILMGQFGWINTLAGVIAPQLIAPVTVIIYKQFFDSVPKDFREAAVIDGANEFQLLFRIYLPMNWGITTALAIITFIGAWNLFLWPFLAVSSEDKMNITVGITQVHDAFGVSYGRDLAVAMLAALPVAARLSDLPAAGDPGDHAVGGHQRMSAIPEKTDGAAAPHVELRRVTKRYGVVTAIDDLSLTVDRGSFTALLGPSGCGKSTLLRMIAGLERITVGQCFLDGVDVTDIAAGQAPHRHGVPVLRPLSAHDGEAEHRLLALARRRVAQRAGRAHAAKSRASSSSSPISTAARPNCRAGSVSAWRSAARWCASRRSFCSTSRFPISTPSCACRCGSNSPSCTPPSARRWSTSPTTRPRR